MVKSVEFDSYEIDYKLVDDGHKDYDITYYTGRVADDELVPTLKKAKTSEGKSIEIKAAIPDNTSTWIFNILSFIVPLILLWVLLAFVSKKMGGSMGMGVRQIDCQGICGEVHRRQLQGCCGTG